MQFACPKCDVLPVYKDDKLICPICNFDVGTWVDDYMCRIFMFFGFDVKEYRRRIL